ncbi:MAG: hypothetical protein QXS20_03335 [Candidatus Thorarchaeota archaeon]
MTQKTSGISLFVDRERRTIELKSAGFRTSFPIQTLPTNYVDSMLTMLDGPESPEDKIRTIYQTTLTKAAVCTWNPYNVFPINVAQKVVRLTLVDEAIDEVVDELEGELLSLQGRPFESTIDERIDLYRRIYLDNSRLDLTALGAIELFGDMTYNNILSEPRVVLSVLWRPRGEGGLMSYQLNCVAEVVEPGAPYYRFMRALRLLFSARFASGNEDYKCAYRFWVCEVIEKSLSRADRGFIPGFLIRRVEDQ